MFSIGLFSRSVALVVISSYTRTGDSLQVNPPSSLPSNTASISEVTLGRFKNSSICFLLELDGIGFARVLALLR